jgi:hypothetical protein
LKLNFVQVKPQQCDEKQNKGFLVLPGCDIYEAVAK